MNLATYLKSVRGIKVENLSHRVTNVCLLGAVIAMSIAVFTKQTIITVVPPTLVEKTWISDTEADASYVESWALFIAEALGNVTPSRATMIRKAIEPLLDEVIYQDVVNAIETQVAAIRRDRVVLQFEPRRILQETKRPGVYYIAGRSTMTGPTGKSSVEDRTYEIHIRLRFYKPVITFLKTYKGGPQTADVIERQMRADLHRNDSD